MTHSDICQPIRPAMRVLLLAAFLLLFASLQGCYYLQAAGGQFELWRKQRPLAEVLADPATDARLAERLRLLQAARDFASETLLLPDNGSYRQYADLGRDYVLWNVIAAPEFSLEPKTWCYPLVGCLAYRGYFDRDDAEWHGEQLREDGLDVYVGGVAAYSTLGRFNDPLLNTMLSRGDAELVALLFHELAHQRLYIADDTGFNESYASAVAELGLQQWFESRGDAALAARWQAGQERSADVMQRVETTRAALATLYDSSRDEPQMRQRKRALYEELRDDLALLTASEGERATLNNARLATMTLYRGTVPAFRRMFKNCAGDWACFHAAVAEVSALSPAVRADKLAAISPP